MARSRQYDDPAIARVLHAIKPGSRYPKQIARAVGVPVWQVYRRLRVLERLRLARRLERFGPWLRCDGGEPRDVSEPGK